MGIEKLKQIMVALRDPETGCPWDKEQDFKSIATYTLEEAYEVIDAIEREDYPELKDELGDLLLQVVFHAQMADEKNLFNLDDVIANINEKMLRRHPHVFGSKPKELGVTEPQDVKKIWEAEKARERQHKNKEGTLDGVAKALPALKRAQKLQKRAANVGFDWPSIEGVKAKVEEELVELEQVSTSANTSAIAEEMGDLLFSCVNWARHLGLDAESCLLSANKKFEDRFSQLEQALQAQDQSVQDSDLDTLEQVWQQVKQNEK